MLKQKLIDTIRAQGLWKGDAKKRRQLLEEMGFRFGEKAEHVIVTGCDPPEIVPEAFRAFKKLLDYLRIEHTLLDKQYCCGWGPLGRPAAVAKNDEDRARALELSREFVRENLRQAEALGTKAVTLFCAACEPASVNNMDGTGLELLSQSQLLDRYYPGGRLEAEIDYYAGCYRFRRRLTDRPLDLEAPLRLLKKIEGLRVNYLDNSLCCYIPPHFDQLAASIKSRTVVTVCVACTTNLTQQLRERGNGNYQVKMLPEILWEALPDKGPATA